MSGLDHRVSGMAAALKPGIYSHIQTPETTFSLVIGPPRLQTRALASALNIYIDSSNRTRSHRPSSAFPGGYGLGGNAVACSNKAEVCSIVGKVESGGAASVASIYHHSR